MKNIATIFILAVVILAMSASGSLAVTMTVGSDSGGSNQNLLIPITVDNPDKLAGAAFTIVFSDSLSVTVDSNFFDTFINQFDPLATTGPPVIDGKYTKFPLLDGNGAPVLDGEGEQIYIITPVTIGGFDYDEPLITNLITTGTNGICVSAARCVPPGPGGITTLFNLTVSLKSGQPTGIYPITIIPTTLNNTDAGYDAAGETIDLLVGSDLNELPTSPNAYPVILDDAGYADHVVNGQVEFTPHVFVDTDLDGMDDDWETDKFGNLSHDGTDDTDHDGYSDKTEYDNDTDPNVQDPPGGNGWNACTDNRTVKQEVSLESKFGKACSVDPIYINTNYDVSTGDNTLSGIELFVYFDSSKVTYAGFANFLAVGDTTQNPDVEGAINDAGNDDGNADTDKMVKMSWTSAAGTWPNQPLPINLCDLKFTPESMTGKTDIPFSVTGNPATDCYTCVTNTEVEWTPIYDVTGDDKVDIVDIMQVAARWNTVNGGPNYNAAYDVDHDGDIDIMDIMKVAAQWGQALDL